MSTLIDVLEEREIVFTVGADGLRAWQNVRGALVEVETGSAINAKREDRPLLAQPLAELKKD